VPEKHVQPLEVRVLVRDHLAQEAVKVPKRLHLAAPELRLVLVVLLAHGEARDRWIERRVHRLMIHRALPLLRCEVDGADALDFGGQVPPWCSDFGRCG